MRAYAPEFKAQVLAKCSQRGASIAKVARVNGLNSNMIHTWRREARPSRSGGGEFEQGSPEAAPTREFATAIRSSTAGAGAGIVSCDLALPGSLRASLGRWEAPNDFASIT